MTRVICATCQARADMNEQGRLKPHDRLVVKDGKILRRPCSGTKPYKFSLKRGKR